MYLGQSGFELKMLDSGELVSECFYCFTYMMLQKKFTTGDICGLRGVLEDEFRQQMFPRIRALLQIGNSAAVYPVENLGEMLIPAMAIQHLLDLVAAQLDVLENGSVGVERAKDAIVAEVDNAVVVFFHGGHERMRVGLVLGKVRVGLCGR